MSDQSAPNDVTVDKSAKGPPGAEATAAKKNRFVTVNGDTFHKFPVRATAEEHVHNLRHMPMRNDDVIIAAYPRSGTHWTWEVVHMLRSGKTEYESRSKEHVMLEFNDVERVTEQASPRIINSHLFLRHLSQEVETKRVPVLHVLRNPKDVVVSLYFFLRQRPGLEDTTFTQFAHSFLAGRGGPDSHAAYFTYLLEMAKWEKEHPDVPLLTLTYEDMKQQPLETVRELARFLGVSASDAFCQEVVEACSFRKLKTAEAQVKQQLEFRGSGEAEDDDTNKPKMEHYRKGEVGDWKNHFTVALSEQFDAAIAERLKGCAYVSKFKYTT